MSYYSNSKDLYAVIRNINPADNQGFVRYFEKNWDALTQLDTEQYLPLIIRYTEALYKLKLFHDLNRACDELIAFSIEENIQYYNEKDIYLRALFLKADALFNLHQFEESNRIFDALINLAPKDKSLAKAYRDCLLRQRKSWVNYIILTGIVFYFISPFAFLIQFLYIDKFTPAYTDSFNLYRGILIVLAFLAVLAGFAAQYLYAAITVYRKVKAARY